MVFGGARYRSEGQAAVKSDEAPVVQRRQDEQVGVRHLTWTQTS